MPNNKNVDYKSILTPDKLEAKQTANPFIKISDAVYSILEDEIVSYELVPGSRINLSKIADSLGISDSPVREAVEKLTENGLLIENPGAAGKYKSYTVFDMAEEDIAMLFNARKSIESAAAYFCAEDNRKLDMKRLLKSITDFREKSIHTVDSVDLDTVSSDRDFHTMLVEGTGNRYLMDMYKTIQRDIRYLSVRSCYYIFKDAGNIYKMNRQHFAIYNAIEQGYPDMARSLMGTHIDFCGEWNIKNNL